ncbi:MAG: cupin domain-containing protein [Lactobacillus sp.]|nr:cupin domain-containing protein [Lactobacillus sp.]
MKKFKDEVQNNLFGIGEKNQYGEFFTGQSYLKTLLDSPDTDLLMANVSFEPGCRNNWHAHNDYQILVGIAGEGFYQIDGQAKKVLHPGEVVVIPKNTKHWHGATDDSWFCHLAIMKKSAKTTWGDPVTDDEYLA